jgi:CRISPR type I-E-associated protein CasB/Cse2
MTATLSPPSLSGLIAGLAKRLSTMGTGPRAELRRLRADGDDRWRAATFYQLYAERIAPDYAGGAEHERAWAMILSGMARLDHRPGHRAGAVLAEHGFAPLRFVRLLDADADHLDAELRAVISFLAAKGAKVDWTGLADLVLSHASDRRDAVRRRLAADFYRALATKA